MRDIPGYEGLYAITSCGKVWSYKKKKFFSPSHDKDGYPRVNLIKDKQIKTFFIHRLVAIAYLPNPNNLPLINHKDEIKTHDWVNNLEWCTNWYNVNYSNNREVALAMGPAYEEKKIKTGRKNNCRPIRCIETGQVFESGADCARKMGLDPSHIAKVCKGKLNTTGGYHFEYVMEDEVND